MFRQLRHDANDLILDILSGVSMQVMVCLLLNIFNLYCDGGVVGIFSWHLLEVGNMSRQAVVAAETG